MKNSLSKIMSIVVLVVMLLLASSSTVEAQCPMCKMAAESNLNEGGTAGEGLNKGILMLFSMPYVLVGGVAFIWYKNRKEEDEWDVSSN